MSDGGNVKLTTRIALILVGAILAPVILLFLFLLVTFATGMGSSRYLGPSETTIIMNVVVPAVGASVGYLAGKRKLSIKVPANL